MKVYTYIFLFFLFIFPVAGESKNPLPRFATLRPNEVNARVGPGANYPVEWVYMKAGLPVEVTVEFDTWRKIRDIEGTGGWVHQSMLCSKRRAIVYRGETLLYGKEDTQSQPLARIENGAVIDLLKCQGNWCQVRTCNFKGWVPRAVLWGTYPDENFK